MVRKSIGLALLAAAVVALAVTTMVGSVSAQIDPFSSAPYSYIPLAAAGAIPDTGDGTLVPGGNALMDWVIPVLTGTGVVLLFLALMRMRSSAR